MTPIATEVLADLPQMVLIERECYPHPWTEEEFVEVLYDGALIYTCKVGRELQAFCIAETKDESLTIINLAVAKKHQRKGIGKRLITHLNDTLEVGQEIVADVWERNEVGIKFFAKCGFMASGVMRRRYGDEDAYRFVRPVMREVAS